MALLFLLTDQATGSFSSEWRWFIAGVVVVAGLVAPIGGYVLFSAALAYPLYSISIYVAALALAVLILLAFAPSGYLPAIILTLSAPLLSTYRVALAAPLVAGLWWGEWGGVLVGLGSALWLKIFAGMAGATPDLIRLGGQSFEIEQLVSRFHTANSLQTLLWLVEPIAPDAQTLLLHILEIVGWALAGYGMGLMRRRIRSVPRPNVSLVAGVSLGLLSVGLGSLALPVALGLRETSVLSISFLLDFLVECGWSGLVVVGLYGVSRYLNRPVVMPAPSHAEFYRSSVRPEEEPAPPSWVRPQPREDEQTDIIMIDLD
ncbi:MAG: hypothetical protein DRI48_05710 [Chloroflexi bacterium]|nr:MAG: hypothetical protein DRI48_05710 [Chloroflexota bacterium]